MIGYGTLFGRSTTCDQDGAYTVRFALPLRIKRCQPRLNWIGTGGALVDNGTRFGWQPPAGWRSTTCDHDEAYTVGFALPLRIERCQPRLNRTRTGRVLVHNGTRFGWQPPAGGRSTTSDHHGAYTVGFALPLRIERCQPRLNRMRTGGAFVQNGTWFGWKPPARWRSTTSDHDEAYTVGFALPLQIERCQPRLNRTRTGRVLVDNGTRFGWQPPAGGRSTTSDHDGAYTVRFALPLRIKRCQPRLNRMGTGGAFVQYGTRFGWQQPAGGQSTTSDQDGAYTVGFAWPLQIKWR